MQEIINNSELAVPGEFDDSTAAGSKRLRISIGEVLLCSSKK
jgi:hypothetical protein